MSNLFVSVLTAFLITCFLAQDGVAAALSLPLCCGISATKSSTVNKKTAVKSRQTVKTRTPFKPAKRYITVKEVESKKIYSVIESYIYRMCIREIPFFFALHQCYYRDVRLNRGDTLALRKKVLQVLILKTASRLNSSELNISPVCNLDSMMIFRSKSRSGKRTTNCNIIIYARPGAYDIPKSGAKVKVPGILRGTVMKNSRSGAMIVTIFTKGVKLVLPNYAKMLSLGMIADMDIRYAELVPEGNGYEARLMYATQKKDVKKRGWSFNVTECNKIRPYAR